MTITLKKAKQILKDNPQLVKFMTKPNLKKMERLYQQMEEETSSHGMEILQEIIEMEILAEQNKTICKK